MGIPYCLPDGWICFLLLACREEVVESEATHEDVQPPTQTPSVHVAMPRRQVSQVLSIQQFHSLKWCNSRLALTSNTHAHACFTVIAFMV